MPPAQSSANPAEEQLARALGLPQGMKVPPETMKLACAGKFGPEVKQFADAADHSGQGGQPSDGDGDEGQPSQGPSKMGASSIFGKPSGPSPAADDGDGDEQAPMNAQRIFGRR
jgi:hypothetical protein